MEIESYVAQIKKGNEKGGEEMKKFLIIYGKLVKRLFWSMIDFVFFAAKSALIATVLAWLILDLLAGFDFSFWSCFLILTALQVIGYWAFDLLFIIPTVSSACVGVIKKFGLTIDESVKAVMDFGLINNKDIYEGAKENFDRWYTAKCAEELQKKYSKNKTGGKK